MSGELDEFRLVRPLGRGGMGEVYLGHDTVLDRAVAIKLIGSRNPDAASRERFLIEARAIARLSHPNVVTIYRVGTTGDGRPFLVQELIRGKSLDQVPRPVPWRQVCGLAIGIARGLEAAHRRGILHRDVKPANVMLDEHGAARLLDFGLAKLIGAGEARIGGASPEPGAADAMADVAATRELAGPGAETAPRDVAATRDLAGPRDVAETREAPAVAATVAGPRGEADAAAVAATAAGPRGEADAAAVAATAAGPRGEADAAAVAATAAGSRGEANAATRRAASDPQALAERTEPGTMLGTPRYTAPEIWRGEPASVSSDLYSLGVMLYELLAGAAPHSQTDLAELQAAALAGRVRPLAELVSDAHPALAAAVMRCLALDPRDRPASAAAVAHEIEAVTVGAPVVPEGNPYRGLRAFDATHRGLFFGRGPDVDAIVDRLRTEPLIAVVGDSGIGKSSVCHAGIVPAVLAGALADRRSWRVVALVPGRAPWAALRGALAAAASGALAAEAMAGPADAADAAEAMAGPADAALAAPADPAALIRALAAPASPGGAAAPGVLLVIDQLEELVTLAAPGEAARVAEALAAIAAGVPGVKALLAVRGDFLTRVAALPELGAPMTRGLHLLRALSAADLREAIAGPARAKGVRYETAAMIDELAAAVAGNPGALPLLSFTLAELWQARDAARGVIPARALEQLGGVGGGLAGHADAVLLALGAGARAAARRIVLRLVTEARTRAVRDRAELAGEGDDAAAAALEHLVRGRLVVARDTAAGTPSYELAHEALIRSWGTLRGWLDEEAGQLAVRGRLQAGAAEWRRLGRRPDLLWTRRQLDEVRGLGELTADERAFVEASRGRLARGRLARAAAIAAVPAAALAIFAGVRWQASRARAGEVGARSATAAEHRAAADRLATAAAAARADALGRFDAGEDAAAEPRWAEAQRLGAEAHARYDLAEKELEAALSVDEDAVRAPLGAALEAHAELAEAEHAVARRDELLRWLGRLDPARGAAWRRSGRITIELDRPAHIAVHALACTGHPTECAGAPAAATSTGGAAVTSAGDAATSTGGGAATSTGGGAATSAEDAAATSAGTAGAPSAVATAAGGGAAATAESGAAATAATAGAAARLAGGFDARPLRTVDGTRLEAELPPGSYLAVIAAPDGAIVRDPFLLARGERLARAIAVPPRAGAPPGFVYIAAGRFLFGTDRDEGIRREFLATQPLHAALTAAFWISRTEVTYGDWLAYLRALPPAERAARGPAAPDVAVEELPDGRFALSIEPAARHRHRAAEGELLVYPGRALRRRVRWERLPVSGVSYHDALAYTAWLDRSGRVRGARLCTVREWERAARGADGRPYPHGDALRPDDANIDATYGRDDDSFGPDEVGAFPASQSPYDVADLAGNVWEWTADARGKPWYKGGSFYQNALTAMSSNGNSPGAAGQRNVRIGLRVCADAARAR